jgi:hypothetical protein
MRLLRRAHRARARELESLRVELRQAHRELREARNSQELLRAEAERQLRRWVEACGRIDALSREVATSKKDLRSQAAVVQWQSDQLLAACSRMVEPLVRALFGVDLWQRLEADLNALQDAGVLVTIVAQGRLEDPLGDTCIGWDADAKRWRLVRAGDRVTAPVEAVKGG